MKVMACPAGDQLQVGAGPPFRNPPSVWDIWGASGAALRDWSLRLAISGEDQLTRSGEALACGPPGFCLIDVEVMACPAGS
jgi:hypothetical protein